MTIDETIDEAVMNFKEVYVGLEEKTGLAGVVPFENVEDIFRKMARAIIENEIANGKPLCPPVPLRKIVGPLVIVALMIRCEMRKVMAKDQDPPYAEERQSLSDEDRHGAIFGFPDEYAVIWAVESARKRSALDGFVAASKFMSYSEKLVRHIVTTRVSKLVHSTNRQCYVSNLANGILSEKPVASATPAAA